MSSLSAAAPREEISSQDEARSRVRDLLTAIAEHLASERAFVEGLYEQRPGRDRSSGVSWRGIETACHVSALLATTREAPTDEKARRRIFADVDRSGAARELRRHEDLLDAPLPRRVWISADGDRLEIACGVRLTVRAISAPYLPGSLSRAATTSPLTPPPRLVR